MPSRKTPDECSGMKHSHRVGEFQPPFKRKTPVDELADEVIGQYDPTPAEYQRTRVLDVFSGPGGVGVALRELFRQPNMDGGFIGVDRADYSNEYPGEFVQMDARELTLDALGMESKADLVWLSPPCSAYSKLSHVHYDDPKEVHPTIPELDVHGLAERLGEHYVIENVVTCDDLDESRVVTLNGGPFGRPINYRRKFEVSFVEQFTDRRFEGVQQRGDDIVQTATASRADLAKAKMLPEAEEWNEQEARSALPPQYVAFILSHCPSLPEIAPPGGVGDYYKTSRTPGQSSLFSYE